MLSALIAALILSLLLTAGALVLLFVYRTDLVLARKSRDDWRSRAEKAEGLHANLLARRQRRTGLPHTESVE